MFEYALSYHSDFFNFFLGGVMADCNISVSLKRKVADKVNLVLNPMK